MAADYNESDVPAQAGRTALITGANTGIGYEAARVLAGRGARVLLGCRSPERGAAARRRIVALHPQADVAVVHLDLASLASIRRAAAQLAKEPLDLLINNAGLMMPPRTLTEDGFESQFGVNHLGHFALTALLIDRIKHRPGARIVTVSSNAHKFGRIDYADPHAERSYNTQARYCMSKLANLLFAFELQRRLEAANLPAVSLGCHPGGSDTDLSRHLPKSVLAMLPLIRPFINNPAAGSLPTLRAATHPNARGGDYYGPMRFWEMVHSAKRTAPAPRANDATNAKKLWDLSVQLTRVNPPIC